MTVDWRIPVVLAANGLLYFLNAEANHYLAVVSLHLTLAGLFPIFAAYFLPPLRGTLCTLFAGACLGALLPVPFLLPSLLLGLFHGGILLTGGRLRRESGLQAIILALFGNLFFFIGLTLATVQSDRVASAEFWLSLLLNLTLSQLCVLLLTRWFLSLQIQALFRFGIDVLAEEHV